MKEVYESAESFGIVAFLRAPNVPGWQFLSFQLADHLHAADSDEQSLPPLEDACIISIIIINMSSYSKFIFCLSI